MKCKIYVKSDELCRKASVNCKKEPKLPTSPQSNFNLIGEMPQSRLSVMIAATFSAWKQQFKQIYPNQSGKSGETIRRKIVNGEFSAYINKKNKSTRILNSFSGTFSKYSHIGRKSAAEASFLALLIR